jgi:hypothetical protein
MFFLYMGTHLCALNFTVHFVIIIPLSSQFGLTKYLSEDELHLY